MTNKKRKTVPTNGDAPATQHDLSILAGEMTHRFEKVDERFEGIERRLDTMDERLVNVEDRLVNVERQVGNVLTLVQSIDGQLKEWRDIPAKVERLHQTVFPRQ